MATITLRTQYEERVLRCARKFARMKAFGTYIENDNVVIVGCEDQERYTKLFLDELVMASESLCNAMAIDEVGGKLVE